MWIPWSFLWCQNGSYYSHIKILKIIFIIVFKHLWLLLYLPVSCGPGTSYNTSTAQCDNCPVGQYQDGYGQFTCSPCSTGLTTDGIGADRADLCVGKHLDMCGDDYLVLYVGKDRYGCSCQRCHSHRKQIHIF